MWKAPKGRAFSAPSQAALRQPTSSAAFLNWWGIGERSEALSEQGAPSRTIFTYALLSSFASRPSSRHESKTRAQVQMPNKIATSHSHQQAVTTHDASATSSTT